MGRVSLKDVAEAAGVSAVTASIVLNGSDSGSRVRVSAARRAEIQAIAARLGYRANAAGRILKSKSLSDIGLLFFEETRHIREHAGFTDMNLQFSRISREYGRRYQVDWFDPFRHPDEVPAILTDGLIGGLLIAGNPIGASEQYLRESCTLPIVRLDEPGKHSVRFDPQPAFRQALEYLAATGHRRLGLVNGPETLPYFRNLHSAFRESCARFDLTVDEELFYEADPYGDFALDAVLAGRRLFDRPDRPDAVMVSSGILVKSIVVQALQRGVRIPADASIVAFGTNDWEAYKFVPRLTAVERNYAGIIEAGVAMLCELMDKGAVQVPQVTVPERFSIRDSTANRLA
ncbi:LacI family DNA-binding transcriptional regulator [Victivallis vadensis]|jgi:transcriptional regulator, lacI family|uniref:LacI family DNA-binding transcriptional regulator n=2 Tax=Victivallis vadensis TaxID=172901 RepID=UPI003AF8C0E7